jgi:hypothetical protein
MMRVQKRFAGHISQYIGIQHPEGISIKEPVSLGECAAGSEDIRLVGELASETGNRGGLEILQDLPGMMVDIDEHIPYTPAFEEVEGMAQRRFSPERKKGFWFHQG